MSSMTNMGTPKFRRIAGLWPYALLALSLLGLALRLCRGTI